ncbi:MAG TPA: hypothetical protein DCR43_02915 [Bacteroidales bacterium]|nr:hypothetical protein [Bacteroidales bacterium]
MNDYINYWPVKISKVDGNISAEIIAALAAPCLWAGENTSGIYFLLDGSEIVYIGRSNNLRKRFEQHSKEACKTYNRWFYMFCEKEDLNKTEAYYILRYRPKYNISIPKVVVDE